MLITLAQLPQLTSNQLTTPFQKLAEGLQHNHLRARALSAFIRTSPETRSEVKTLVETTNRSESPNLYADMCVSLATRVHPIEAAAIEQLTEDQFQALRRVRTLTRDATKASYLEKLAPCLLHSQSLEAQNVAQEMDSLHSAKALIALAVLPPVTK